ncbi:MAG: hypothetical protein ACT4PT_01240 [Methanobacteriota archaeon]
MHRPGLAPNGWCNTSSVSLNLGAFFALVTLGFSVLLFAVSAVSYLRIRRRGLLFVSGAFLFLVAKGAYESYRVVVAKEDILVPAALDFGVLLFLYASIAQRDR